MAQEEEEEEEDDSDASSYDDFSSSGSDDDEEKQRRKEERQKRKAARAMEWGPVWNPPKQPPPLPPKAEKARRVFVGNVPPGVTEEAVRKCFGDFGAIDAVEIHSDHAFVCVCTPFIHSFSIQRRLRAALRPGCTRRIAAAGRARARPCTTWPGPTSGWSLRMGRK